GGVSGVADGEMNSLTGSSNLTMSGLGTIGQSIMSAESGGKGPSSALTSAKLNITGTDDVSKDITVQGSVSASGDKTYVHSVSSIVEKNGVQTITNFQNSSSQSQVATSNGQVQGSGTQNFKTSLLTDTAHDGNGQTLVFVNGEGNATGNSQTSALNINTNGQLSNSNGLNNTAATGDVSGVADGEMNSLTGSSNLTMNGSSTIGQSIMSAEGGGKGPSSALTSAKLNVNGTNHTFKDITVQGSVSASGDKTYVHSVSSIVEKNGVQTITNFQNSSSQSQEDPLERRECT
uniref:Uncharacterized protein n=1 Tax=Parascaris univalens TaxID=6257 RepID=A0A914ZD61_PARUN